jgi:hypothetical protein
MQNKVVYYAARTKEVDLKLARSVEIKRKPEI